METVAPLRLRRVRDARAAFPVWSIRAVPAATLWHLLSHAERERASRFRRESLRDRYATAHAALRLLIESRTGVAASDQHFMAGPDGKPILAEQPTIRHNISYGGDRALIGLGSRTGIGVDLEQVRPIQDARDLARACFTRRERMALRRARSPDRCFLSIWVRKEACVKAIGHGLRQSLDAFQCGTGGGGTAIVAIDHHRLRVGNLDPGSGYVGAWAELL